MRVFVTGGTGLIGRHLIQKLQDRGDQPVVLSRRADEVRRDRAMRGFQVIQGDPMTAGPWQSAVDGCDAVVHLAGQNIFAKRWNTEIKRQIRDSRVYGTEHVVSAIAQARSRPKVLVSSSAIGYYGPRGDEELTEESAPGSDFMAVVCREWEESAHVAEQFGLRVARIRTGVVLDRNEGALAIMTPIFKWLPGGAAPIGSGGGLKPALGQQWMSWIHVDDIAGIYLLALDNPAAEGPINGTAPNPARNADFGRALAKAVHRPFVPVGPPDSLLGLVLGDVAQVVTKGQRVLPAKAQALGYSFKYPKLQEALDAVFTKPIPKFQPAPPKMAPASHH
ncbi:MAG: TIGR01777 family oxidoreductase [Isosphaeraceae bacterium]|nr:TIGR01777 family oxidoreductase [Isosphaeraceae bacterium]